MIHQIKHIVIVGGGSAGWITATTLMAQLPDIKITVIESSNIPTVGVGESTIGGIRSWLKVVGIADEEFMSAADASYKLAIRFNNFYNKDFGTWYYPFGQPQLIGNTHNRDDWFIKKALIPSTPEENYAESYYPQMALVNNNCVVDQLEDFNLKEDSAFHFDAAKFGAWLRDNKCKTNGVIHVEDEVAEVKTDKNGIKSLILKSGQEITANLFIDCTGFTGLLIDKTLNVPFKNYENILPNNRAWATKVEYTDKETQLNLVTDCTAIDNGWVGNIPLWSRIGTGYVYNDRAITPLKAREDFIKYLNAKGFDTNECEFKDIKMRVGIHEKLWEKNVCAIGLSAGFIEPLESTGLFTVHEFALNLSKILKRRSVSQWDRDEFNLICKDQFNYWVQFVSMHYALSHRDDTPYWQNIKRTSYVSQIDEANQLQTLNTYHHAIYTKKFKNMLPEDDGINCLAAGMNWNPIDTSDLKKHYTIKTDLNNKFKLVIDQLNYKVNKWKEAVKTAPSLYQYLKDTYYTD